MVDLAIIILVCLGIYVGAKRGFTRELVNVVGFIVCLVLAFLLKNPIAAFMYEHLPFFSFGGIVKGVTVLNILFYEVIAFIITFSILMFVLKIVKLLTNIFEGFLNATVILGIPSKILGGLLGAVEWLVISFIVLFVIALPVFNNRYVYESKIYDSMFRLVPRFSKEIDNTMTVVKEFEELKDKYENEKDVNQFNLDSLDLVLKYRIIDVNSADKLYKKGKFKTINNIESVLDKYRVAEEN